MKLSISFAMLAAFSCIQAQKNALSEFITRKYCGVASCTTQPFGIPISQKDFYQNGTFSKTVVLDKPGQRYYLCQNIQFDPQQKVAAAIEINADNVILDINGKSLEQINGQTQVTGIVAITGHTNISIVGNFGSIKNFSQRGIYIQGGNQYVSIGETPLFLINNGKGTPVALIDGDQPIIQGGMQLGEMSFLTAFGFPAVKGPLTYVTVSHVTTSENNIGVGLGDGSNYFFSNNTFSGNRETRPIWPPIGHSYFGSSESAVVCYGLAYFSNGGTLSASSTRPAAQTAVQSKPGTIENIHFHNCHFDSNVADASQQATTTQAYCDGFALAVGFSALKITQCTFNNNEAILAPKPGVNQFNQTRGCVIGGGSTIVIEDSEFSDNKGGGFVDGINISGLIPVSPESQAITSPRSLTFRRCVASNNKARTNGATIVNPATLASGSQGSETIKSLDVAGFVIRFPAGSTLIDCVAEDNSATIQSNETDYFTYTDGVLLFANIAYPEFPTNNIEIRGIKCSRNRSNGLQGETAGIAILDGLTNNVTIRDSTISENSFFDQSNTFFAVGIDITGATRESASLVSVYNCTINSHNLAGVFTSLLQTNIQNNRISDNGIGVLLAPFIVDDQEVGFPDFSSVLDNTLLSNGIAILDQGSQQNPPRYSTSLVANNRAFNNAEGYLVTYAAGNDVPVSSGTLTNFPPFPPAVLETNVEFRRTTPPVRKTAAFTKEQNALKSKIRRQRWKY